MSVRRWTALTATGAAAAVSIAVGSAAAAQSAPAGAGQLQAYVVTLSEGSAAPDVLAGRAAALGGRRGVVFDSAVRGFSVVLPTRALARLRALPGVAAVEPDGVVQATSVQGQPPSYGLDRVDQRSLPLNGSYRYRGTGSGVTAYVVDTGVRLRHEDFGGRAVTGVDLVDGGPASDCNGHGTHVAGTLGGAVAGVAKGVRLVSVRVLDCGGYGTISDVVAGLDWVVRDHVAGEPAVANLSLNAAASPALDQAVQAAVADGVLVIVAAGNAAVAGGGVSGAADACNSSPARVRSVLTVGATTRSDARADYSNGGPCLDLFAPGSDVVSDWSSSNTATQVLSGTSMAAPHVAGIAALYLQAHRAATPAQVAQAVVAGATAGKVKNAGAGSPNLLAFSRF